MKKIFLILLLGTFFAQGQQIVKSRFRYNQKEGILYNKDYRFKCINYVHRSFKLYVDLKKYRNGISDYSKGRTSYIKKYIIVKDIKTSLISAIEYWVMPNKKVMVLLVKLNNRHCGKDCDKFPFLKLIEEK